MFLFCLFYGAGAGAGAPGDKVEVHPGPDGHPLHLEQVAGPGARADLVVLAVHQPVAGVEPATGEYLTNLQFKI